MYRFLCLYIYIFIIIIIFFFFGGGGGGRGVLKQIVADEVVFIDAFLTLLIFDP